MQGRRNGRGGAHDRSFASIFSAAGLLAGLLVAANGARAQEVGPPDMPDSVGPKHPITAYNGSYTYSIRIEVPAFRGIEPKLKLSYDSARGVRNAPSTGSWLGVGWKLDGLSAIERVSGSWKPPVDFSMQKLTGGRGSPAYVETEGPQPADSFTLDGDEIIPCSELGTPGSPANP